MTFRISPSRGGEPTWAESMTIRSPRRAGVARADERLTGVVERAGVLEVAALVTFLAAAAFLAVAFLAAPAGVFLIAVFFVGAFLVLVLLLVDLFDGTRRLPELTAPLRVLRWLADATEKALTVAFLNAGPSTRLCASSNTEFVLLSPVVLGQ